MTLRIATRESKLALVQAHSVAALLEKAGYDSEIFARSTKGDQQQDGRALAEWGYKGLFTKEIDAALIDGEADIAVHSMKDMPSELPPELSIAAVLVREQVEDAFLSPLYKNVLELPDGSTVGTASLRRGSQLLHTRPDLNIVPFRGNVQTRLKKLKAGEVDATLLAMAGLRRLGLEAEASDIMSHALMLPAVAQGAIAVTCRSDDVATKAMLAPLNHVETELCVTAERAMLAALDGSCRTPIAGYAKLMDGKMQLKGRLVHPSGNPCFEAEGEAKATLFDAQQLGANVGASLKAQAEDAGQNFTEWCK